MATAVSADEIMVLSVQEFRDMLARAFERGQICAAAHRSDSYRKECNAKERS